MQARPYFAAATSAASDAAAFVLSRTLGSSCRQLQGILDQVASRSCERVDGDSEASQMSTRDLVHTQVDNSDVNAVAQPIRWKRDDREVKSQIYYTRLVYLLEERSDSNIRDTQDGDQ